MILFPATGPRTLGTDVELNCFNEILFGIRFGSVVPRKVENDKKEILLFTLVK